jgi:ketosteroid isomerase-like protein
MSQENVEIARRYWESLDNALERYWANPTTRFSESSFLRDSVLAMFQPDAEWISAFAPKKSTGPGMLRSLDDWLEASEEWRVEAEEIIEGADNRVLSVVRVSIRGRGSGVPVEQRLYTVLTLRDKRIAHVHDFTDRHEALEAAGLRQ